MPVRVRQCIRCEFLLPLATSFTRHRLGREGYQAACKACESERLQLRKHGVTSLEKEWIAEAQNGCAICGTSTPGPKGWIVDHDHACCPGEASCPTCRRGILCHRCNTALGYAADDPARLRRMADYLELGSRLGDTTRLTDDRYRLLRTETDGLTKRTEESQPSLTSCDARAHVQEIR